MVGLICSNTLFANDNPFYYSIAISISHLNESHHTREVQGINPELDVTTSTDGVYFGVQFALGYNYQPNLRVEIKALTSKYDLDDTLNVIKPGILGVPAGSSIPITGDFSINAILVGVNYDFVDMNLANWTPYFSTAIGLADIKLRANTLGGSELVNDDDRVSLYNIGFGVSKKFTNFILDIAYNYLNANQPRFQGSINPALNFNSQFETNTLSIGTRFSF